MSKKIYYLLFASIISIFIMSCGSHFNPRYYYNRGSGPSTSSPEGPDIGGGGEGLDPKDDPFQTGDWNNPDYGFSMNFDEYVIEAKFDGNNRPSYKLVKGTWNQGDPQKNEYWYNGPDTEGGGTGIGSVKYYLYKGKNPRFQFDSGYNKSDRLDRFYFYRFTGSAFGVSIDNCLIAIDTYSKLVFAFAVPNGWKKPVNMPGVPYAPTGWGAVESGWEAGYGNNSKLYFNSVSGIQYFYEYDPVGIVHSDGTIEIYDWCLDSIGNNNKYAPKVEGNKIDLDRQIAKIKSPGRSPYMPIKVEEGEASEEDEQKYKDDIIKLNNKDFKYRDYSGYTSTKPSDKEQISDLAKWAKDYAGKSLMLYTYSLTDNGETITIKQEHFAEGNKGTHTYKLSKINSATKATYANVNNASDTKSVTIMKSENETTIEALLIDGMAVDFAFVDYGPVFADRVRNARFEYGGIRLPPGSTYVPGFVGTVVGGTINNIVYQFNEDGTSFTLTYDYDGKKYTYENKLARFDSDINNMWAAKYESKPGASLGNYIRVVLRDNNKLIRSSMTLNTLGFWDDPSSDAGLNMIGNRK